MVVVIFARPLLIATVHGGSTPLLVVFLYTIFQCSLCEVVSSIAPFIVVAFFAFCGVMFAIYAVYKV